MKFAVKPIRFSVSIGSLKSSGHRKHVPSITDFTLKEGSRAFSTLTVPISLLVPELQSLT